MTHLSLYLDEAKELCQKAVNETYGLNQSITELVSFSPQPEMAHAAFPCHSLAKSLKQSPKLIAQTLCQAVQKYPLKRIKVVQELNGYLNFIFDLDLCLKESFEQCSGEKYLRSPMLEKSEQEKIIVEFSQPNTHKALHLGHLRNTIYGDVVCNLLEAIGHHIVRATYPGDMGAHIAKAIWFIQKFKKTEIPQSPDAHWLGEMYSAADAYLKNDPPESVKQEIYQVALQLEKKSGETYELYLKTREWSLDEMKSVYEWLNVRFDKWFYESECDQPSKELVKKKFEEGFFVLSEGAIGIDLNEYDLGFAIYLKSDGSGLYLTKDLELIKQKFSDPTITKSIYVVDSRQRLHFQQLFKTAELMGFPQAKKSLFLGYELVTDTKGAPFSSRTMNAMSLKDFNNKVSHQVIEQYLTPLKSEWSDTQIEELSEQIVLGAIKYGMLKIDPNRSIQFVLEDWLKLDGETGPYLQYVHARCSSILKKVGEPIDDQIPHLESLPEQLLILHIEKFKNALLQAATEYKPSIFCAYLFDLAKLFNRFYKECPIKTAASPELMQSRLALVKTTQMTLRRGLSLLGIPAPLRL